MDDNTNKPAPKGRVRHCWNCGADMGFVEDRYYDRTDTCGKLECEREARDAHNAEWQDARDEVDDRYRRW